jgi:hypothetical protein
MLSIHEEQSSAKAIVADIHSAITVSKRSFVLSNLYDKLTSLHGIDLSKFCLEFMHSGGLLALFLQLNSLLRRSCSTAEEHKVLCYCIDTLLKHLPPEQIFNVSRIENFFCLLVELLENFSMFLDDFTSTKSMVANRAHISIPQSIMSTFHTISCTSQGSTLIYHNQTSINAIVKILSLSYGLFDVEALHEALGVLKNLTYYEEGSRHNLLQVEGMLLALINLPRQLRLHANNDIEVLDSNTEELCSKRTSSVPTMKSVLIRLSAVLRNLSLAPECRSTLVGAPSCLSCIIEILIFSEEAIPRESITSIVAVARNVLHILVNLAMDSKESALIILMHHDSLFIRLLAKFIGAGTQKNHQVTPLSALHDSVVRKRSVRLIRLCINLSTVRLLMHDRGLINAITDAALLDDCLAVRTESTETFSKLAGMFVSFPKDKGISTRSEVQQEVLLDGLSELFFAASRPHNLDRSVSCATLARAFRELATNAEYRVPMLNRIDLIKEAAAIANLPHETHLYATSVDDICAAFLYLSIESGNRAKLCRMPEVLNVLIENSNPIFDNQRITGANIRANNSIQAIINLASEEANLSILAKYPGALQRLIQFAKTAHVDLENIQPNEHSRLKFRKDGVKTTILKLVTRL